VYKHKASCYVIMDSTLQTSPCQLIVYNGW